MIIICHFRCCGPFDFTFETLGFLVSKKFSLWIIPMTKIKRFISDLFNIGFEFFDFMILTWPYRFFIFVIICEHSLPIIRHSIFGVRSYMLVLLKIPGIFGCFFKVWQFDLVLSWWCENNFSRKKTCRVNKLLHIFLSYLSSQEASL